MKILTKEENGNYEIWNWDNQGQLFTTCEPYEYTSGILFTRDKFKYGYFEIKAKVPNEGKILWPAFWLWAGGGADYREIDIYEFCCDVSNKVGFNMHIAKELDNGYVHTTHHVDDNGFIRNNYPSHYIVANSPNVTDGFHTYGVMWTPNKVAWYVDGNCQYIVTKHTPHLDMHLIVNMAVAQWWAKPNSNLLPATYEIDYVRAYKKLGKEFWWEWGNNQVGKISNWHLHPTDKFYVGDYNNDGKDEIIAVSQTGWVTIFKHNNQDWIQIWDNGGNGKIKWWNLNAGDQFVSGDFNNDGYDELLVVNSSSKWSQLYKFDGSEWHQQWANGGNGKIKWWNLNAGDQLVSGDFNNDGYDELLIANSSTKWSQLYKFDGNDWHQQWANGGNGKIKWWNLNAGDQFVSGDFNNDGYDELLIANSSTKWSQLYKFDGSDWHQQWANGGNGKIKWWNLNAGDQFVSGDFDSDGKKELFCSSHTEWGQLYKFNNGDWNHDWSNDGAGTINLWFMKNTDKYFAGNFKNQNQANLFIVSQNGWSHMLNYDGY